MSWAGGTERFLGARKIGTTGRGIGPCYQDKFARVGVRAADVLDEKILTQKVEAALETLSRIGGPTRFEAHAEHLDAENIEDLAEGCDLILDGTDNLGTRYLVNDYCVDAGLPWIYGGVVGSGGLVLPVLPGDGPCLRCVFPEPPPAGALPTCETAGVILPAVVMGVPGIALITRLTRASTLEVISQDYIRTARAKGLSEFTVQRRHVLRNAMIPVITMLGFSLAGIAFTSFIVERFFGIPGIGNLFIESIFARDFPIINAVIIIGTTMFVAANLVVDLLYPWLDPRIRLGGAYAS